MSTGYEYTREQLGALAVRTRFPERSQEESALIWDFLLAHMLEYERYSITVRVGQGATPNPDHLPGVQDQTVTNSQLRIDMVAWAAAQPFFFEAKRRANHHAIGQLFAYQHLWMEENPSGPQPRLAIIARTIEPDIARVCYAKGIDVYLYPAAAGDGSTTGGGLPPNDG